MSNAYVRLSRGELIARLKLCEGSGAAISRSHGGNHEPARAALADSEERLRAILETAVEGIITINERGVIEDVNPAACKLFDYVREELTGRNVKSLMPAPYRAEHDGYLSNYRDTGHAKIIGIGREVVGQRRDGSTFPMELSVAEVDLASGRRFVGFVRDISARKESEQRTLAALKELTDIKAALDEHSIVAVTDSAGRITHVNEKFCLLSKYSRAELIGKDHRIINSRHHPKEFFRNLWTTIARGKVWRGEIKNRAKDGSHYWVDTTIFPFLNHHGKPTQYIAIRTDITERKAHEEKLIKFADLQAALRASEREVLAVTERERARFGGELHDGLGQQLTAIELMCRSLKEDLQDSRPELEKQVAQICQYLREAISQTRSLARGLAPVEVEGAGLAEALQELARRTHELGKAKCHFICSGAVPVADNNVAGHLYRIAQEAVNNALKHAHSSEITISLMHQSGTVRLEIADNGKGLPKRPKAGGGIGLRVMKHRASVTEADLEVVSAAGKGTRIICTLRKKQP